MKQKNVLPILFVTLLIDMIGVGMVIPIIPVIFTDPQSPSFMLQGFSVGQQYLISGLVTALFGFMQFLAAPILGELSDVYGRKKLLTIGVGVLAIAQLLFGFGIHIGSLSLLFISRAIAGIAGANFSIAQASISDITLPKDRAKNFGLMGAAFGVGFILGPLLGGWLAGAAQDAAVPFWVAGMLGVFNLLFISLFLPETRLVRSERQSFTIFKGVRNIRTALRDVDARPVYVANFLYMSGFAFFTSFIGILLASSKFSFSESSIGTFFAIVGVWIVITQGFILRMLTRTYNERQIIRYTLPVLASAIFFYPLLPNEILIYAIIPFLSIPSGLTMANMNSLVSKSVSPDKQGAALGISGSLTAFANGVIPLIAGIGSGFMGIQAPFFAGGMLVILAWLVLFRRGAISSVVS
jgi:DHA1 family tetracycline resistance protein-like MFS transporter